MAIGGSPTAALVVHEHWRDVWTIPLAGLCGRGRRLPDRPARRSGSPASTWLCATFAFTQLAMPSLLGSSPA